jgi:hypothetical protein
MTADECEKEDEYDKEEGRPSILLSSPKTPQNTSSARRKMWGEDGSDARRIKLT